METNDIEIEVLSKEEKRENRRQRRIRNQRIAYISLILTVILLIAALVGGIVFFKYQIEEKKQQELEEQIAESEIEDFTEDILNATEEEVMEENSGDNTMGSTEYTDEMVLDEVVEAVISEMTLEEKVAGLFIVTPESITGVSQAVQAGEGTRTALEKYPVGGLIYFQKNIQSEEQVKKMVENSRAFSKYPLFIAADESLGESSQLASYGINLNFVSMANATEGNGATVCIKGFPYGNTESNEKQNGLAVIDKSLEELKRAEIVSYVNAIANGVDMIMVGHMSLPQVVGDNTSITMSKEVISDLLRAELGYNGVVITDAMNISAITEYYGADEVAIRAFKAGADMVLMPENFETAYKGVIAAVQEGTISEERINDSLKRVFRIKYADRVIE
ncbi:MAG: glycoside hydrolase family 3 protein [Lachnospiraceae bacterium]|nr:glycoside hydrolase family 3 protein [Lachnospiraceae bacterium]